MKSSCLLSPIMSRFCFGPVLYIWSSRDTSRLVGNAEANLVIIVLPSWSLLTYVCCLWNLPHIGLIFIEWQWESFFSLLKLLPLWRCRMAWLLWKRQGDMLLFCKQPAHVFGNSFLPLYRYQLLFEIFWGTFYHSARLYIAFYRPGSIKS